LNLDELRSIDISSPGSWPVLFRGFVVAVLAVAVVGAGYWFVIKGMLVTLDTQQKQEIELKAQFETKARKASALNAYRSQLEEMKVKFGTMLRQLPGEAEVANLLQDISQTRVESGLEENLFKPANESKKEFYAELPIKVEFVGQFHDYGLFTQGLGELPRIVTLHDISLTSSAKGKDAGTGRNLPLKMTATAKTYRYLEDDEQSEDE
jgi:type IV pilus assembly protein PilO